VRALIMVVNVTSYVCTYQYTRHVVKGYGKPAAVEVAHRFNREKTDRDIYCA